MAKSLSVPAGDDPNPRALSFSEQVPDDGTPKAKSSGSTSGREQWKKLSARFSHKLSGGVAAVGSNVLTAYMGFKDPKKRKMEFLIPKDRAAWLEWMLSMAKKRVVVEYLTDKELRKVIIRARPNLSPYKKAQGTGEDPDVPPCMAWNEVQVGDWITSMGWPHLRETFVKNAITGRKLVLIDCSALNKMGMSDLASMREVAGKIRELLGIPPPNQLRAIMRVSPYERFLRRKVYNGRSYDELTFQKFCETEGYNYELVSHNRNMLIPCTTEVQITTPEHADLDEEGGAGGSDDQSLLNAPTVEFLVRNALVRNKTVEQLMEDIMQSVFLPPRERKYGKDVWGQLKRGIGEGFDDLHMSYPKERLEFAAGVAHSLIEELYHTVAVLNDINELEKFINENITKEDMDMFRSAAQTLMEEALPLVSLLALGELDLETIFKQEPEFQQYVKELVDEAEKRTNELVPDASAFVDEVISEALKRVPKLDLSGLQPDTKENLLQMTEKMSEHISKSSLPDVEIMSSPRASDTIQPSDDINPEQGLEVRTSQASELRPASPSQGNELRPASPSQGNEIRPSEVTGARPSQKMIGSKSIDTKDKKPVSRTSTRK